MKPVRMDSDSKLLFSYIPLATIVFITAMVIYDRQHTKVVDELRSQIKTAKTESVRAPVVDTTEVNSTPSEEPVNPPEVRQPEVTPPEEVNQPEANAAPPPPVENTAPIGMAANQASVRMSEIDKDVETLQSRLSVLQRDLQVLDERMLTFQKQQAANLGQQRLEVDQRISVVMQSLNDVDQKLKTMTENANTAPPEIPLRNLRSQRGELQNQLAELNLAKSQLNSNNAVIDSQKNTQISGEKERILADQDETRRRINQLQLERADLAKQQANETRTLQAQ